MEISLILLASNISTHSLTKRLTVIGRNLYSKLNKRFQEKERSLWHLENVLNFSETEKV